MFVARLKTQPEPRRGDIERAGFVVYVAPTELSVGLSAYYKHVVPTALLQDTPQSCHLLRQSRSLCRTVPDLIRDPVLVCRAPITRAA